MTYSSCTNTLARTVAYVQAFVQLRPLSGIGLNATYPLEPALSIGDWVKQTMLSPPYAWRWNRTYSTFYIIKPVETVVNVNHTTKAVTYSSGNKFKTDGTWTGQYMWINGYSYIISSVADATDLTLSTAPGSDLTGVTVYVGGQDRQVSISTFGWLERALASDVPSGGTLTKELTVRLSLGVDSTENEPVAICPQFDDLAGNITFRIFPTPDTTYLVGLSIQQAAPLFTALTDTWTPIPDILSYLYNTGFMAKAYEQKGDERFAFIMQNFFNMLNSHHTGLGETQENIFLRQRMADLSGTSMKEPPPSVRYNIAERG